MMKNWLRKLLCSHRLPDGEVKPGVECANGCGARAWYDMMWGRTDWH